MYFEGPKGTEVVESAEIPEEVAELAKEKRTELIEQLADVDDEMAEVTRKSRNPGGLKSATI